MPQVRSDNESNTCESKTRIHRHLFLTGNLDFNHSTFIENESIFNRVLFNKKIFNDCSDKPALFLSCLVEFGCESLLPHFYLPYFAKKYHKFNKIILGWPGREVFYKDYADQFWAIDDRHLELRNYTKAFTGMSKNISLIEKGMRRYGAVFSSKNLNNFFCEGVCRNCQTSFISFNRKFQCDACKSIDIVNSILGDTNFHKQKYIPLKLNFENYKDLLNKVFKRKKVIGIFARNRVTYGRNLPAIFYKKLCKNLENKGYKIIWLGEKVSTLPCVSKKYFDFTTSEYADDLNACLALVSKCAGTFQAWTASTRLSQITNTPFCLVESFDQLFGSGQEGKRLNLLTRDMKNKKIIISNFNDSMEKLDSFADLCAEKMDDLVVRGDSTDCVGAVHNVESVNNLIVNNDLWNLIS